MSVEPGGGELQAVVERYARRDPQDPRYSLLRPEVRHSVHERQRATLALLAQLQRQQPQWPPLQGLRLVEVGCGNGSNLLELLRYGFAPRNLVGLELLPDLVQAARAQLPDALHILQGDASAAPIEPASQHIVLASTVFSSLLDGAFQQQLAASMWSWLQPGGGVLWYDFTFDNPRNPDVRGVPLTRVRELFPEARIDARRVTLAPPLARIVCAWHPSLYTVFNAVPLLRTHLLAWIHKPL